MQELIDQITAAVCASPHYRNISQALIRRLAAQELAKGRGAKETARAVRSKLHQVGGAYLERPIDYQRWLAELEGLPVELSDPDLRSFCRRLMQQHASTSERLPFLESFYAQVLASLAPVRSLLDVGCGLNPLSLPWMPLAANAEYFACDIYTDMVDFLNRFLAHLGRQGRADVCDLTEALPSQPAQVALLLKTLPCLEQLDKNIALRLLAALQVEHLLVSFPARSLGGRQKGMVRNYEAHFRQLLSGRDWHIQRFEFANELAFLISL